MRFLRPALSLASLALICRLLAPAFAADAPKPPTPEKPAEKAAPALSLLPAESVTHHQIALAGKELHYTATAGTLALRDDKGEKEADIFYVSFTLDGVTDKAHRPITYVFNGGPGAAAAYLNIGAIGPRALDFGGAGRPQPIADEVRDNPDTWLPFTDLVFIDPAGTGYSRAVNDEASKRLWSVDGDLDALAKIIRLHLTKSDRLASPVYLVGESYGGFRAARLAGMLARQEGVSAAGILLISPALEFEMLSGDRFDLLPWALRLPSYAAVEIAAHTPPTPAALTDAEHFALGDYLVGLASPAASRPENFYARVAALIGIDEPTVARWRGRVPPGAYAKARRRAESEIVSSYDGTVTAPDPDPASPFAEEDPVLDGTIAPFTRAFTAYAQGELGYRTDLGYRLLDRDVNRHWQWREGEHGDRHDLGAADALARALSLQPHLKLLIAHGLTDLTTPYMMSRYIVDHLPSNVTAERVTLKLYDGGHMMYLRQGSRHELREDAAAFYGGS
jgi:carboxypeptidase C (cathepsin A)